jgi:gluconate 2-dehydrogenase gamma chain
MSLDPKLNKLIEDMEVWQLNRRNFLRNALIAGAMTQIASFTSCSTTLKKGNDLLTGAQSVTLDTVLAILFPDDGNGPGADDINAFGYFIWVLQDELNRKPEANSFIIEGLDWLNNEAIKEERQVFYELSPTKRSAFIDQIAKTKFGKNWVSAMVSLIFEALLLDPIYGGNKDEQGWKWLNHQPGYPRPTEEQRYEVFMKRQMKINE